MILKIFLLLFLISAMVYGQNIDSLKHAALLSKSDSTRVQLYLEISETCDDKQLDTIIKYSYLAKQIDEIKIANSFRKTEKLYYSKNLAGSFNNLGWAFQKKGDNTKALIAYKNCIAIQLKIGDLNNLPISHINLANLYEECADTTLALESYFTALEYFKRDVNKTLYLSTLEDIASLYLQKKKFAEAEKYIHLIMNISKTASNSETTYTALNYLGYLNSIKRDTTKAIDFYLQSLSLATKADDVFSMAGTYNDLGGIYRDKKNFKEAEINFKKGIKLLELSGNENDLTTLFRNYTKLFVAKGNLKEAEHYALKGMDYAIKSEDRNNVMKLAELLCTIYKAQPKKALEYCSLYEHLNDSIKTLKINNQQLFEEYSKNYALLEAEENKKNNAAQLSEKPIISNIGIYLVSGIVVSLIGLFLFLKRKKK